MAAAQLYQLLPQFLVLQVTRVVALDQFLEGLSKIDARPVEPDQLPLGADGGLRTSTSVFSEPTILRSILQLSEVDRVNVLWLRQRNFGWTRFPYR